MTVMAGRFETGDKWHTVMATRNGMPTPWCGSDKISRAGLAMLTLNDVRPIASVPERDLCRKPGCVQHREA